MGNVLFLTILSMDFTNGVPKSAKAYSLLLTPKFRSSQYPICVQYALAARIKLYNITQMISTVSITVTGICKKRM